MTIVNDYQSGTASVANGSTAVTGVGTAWQVDANNPVIRPGDLFGRGGLWVPIASVTDNTHLTLAENWPGATLSGSAYRIRIQPDGSRYTAAARTLVEMLANGKLASLAAQAGAADKLPYLTGATTFGLTNLTAKARELLGQADEAAMRAFLSLVLQTSALDAATGRILTVGAFGLGGIDGASVPAGASLNGLAATQMIAATDTAPTGWDGGLGNYPMGVHWQRSSVVQAQFAIGFNGEAGFRSKVDATTWQAWRKLFHNRNVVGTVGQSSGVPTGAVIERGSNANGDYTRWADGTQICTGSFSSGTSAWTAGTYASERQVPGSVAFPAAFAAAPLVQARNNDGQLKSTGAYVAYLAATATAMSNIWLVSPVQTGPLTAATTIFYEAYGRWF